MSAATCYGVMLLLAAGAAPAEPVKTPAWEPLLWWLPEDTETVIVAPGPFEVPRLDKQLFCSRENLHLLPAAEVLAAHDGSVQNQLAGFKIVCALQGGRRFTPPRGTDDSARYEGCHILQVETDAEHRLGLAYDSCLRFADKKIEMARQQVAQFDVKTSRGDRPYFVARPRPGILIRATDRAYLEETLKRSDRKADRRTLPADLPEWKQVDVTAGVWAVRHYRKETAAADWTSPLRRGHSPVSISNDLAATGFVFRYTPGPKATFQARYLSTSSDALSFVWQGWIHDAIPSLKPTILPKAPGVVEITTSITTDNEAGFLRVLLAYLGYAVAI